MKVFNGKFRLIISTKNFEWLFFTSAMQILHIIAPIKRMNDDWVSLFDIIIVSVGCSFPPMTCGNRVSYEVMKAESQMHILDFKADILLKRRIWHFHRGGKTKSLKGPSLSRRAVANLPPSLLTHKNLLAWFLSAGGGHLTVCMSCSCRPFKVNVVTIGKPQPCDLNCNRALMHPLHFKTFSYF